MRLGSLGSLVHFRCQHCGMQFSRDDERIDCSSCEYDYSAFDPIESTNLDDHGVCWSCHREIINGERCGNCYKLGHIMEVCELNENR